MLDTTTQSIPDTDTDVGTDCCAHELRAGLNVTYSDGCTAWWDDDSFTFTHAHPDRGDAVVTYDEPDA